MQVGEGKLASLASGSALASVILATALCVGAASANATVPQAQDASSLPVVSIMDLMLDAEEYAGERVVIRGEALKDHGNLRSETRRGNSDWVLRDECCDAWVTAKGGAEPPRPPQDAESIDVVGLVETQGRTVYVVAESAVPTPPRPKPVVRIAVTSESGRSFLNVCEDFLVRVNLVGEVPVVPMRWHLTVQDEEIAAGGVPFRYEDVPQREYEIKATLLFEHYYGSTRMEAERGLLAGGGAPRGLPGQKEMHFELEVEEEESRKIVATGRADILGDCSPPACYPDRGCLQKN